MRYASFPSAEAVCANIAARVVLSFFMSFTVRSNGKRAACAAFAVFSIIFDSIVMVKNGAGCCGGLLSTAAGGAAVLL